MNEFVQQENDLALADRHIEEAQTRVAVSAERIRISRSMGFDVTVAEKSLQIMLEILATFKSHRRLILKDIDRQKSLLRRLVHSRP